MDSIQARRRVPIDPGEKLQRTDHTRKIWLRRGDNYEQTTMHICTSLLTGRILGGYGAPSMPQEHLLASPEAFNRPINRALAFTPFQMLKLQDMDDFLDDLIRPQPPILSTHDVLPEDCGRFMNVRSFSATLLFQRPN